MKILFGTHHLEERGGSELFTAELASSVHSRGHDVAVFTFIKGPIADEIEARGIRVFDFEDAGAISQFDPDIVQTSHHPCAHFLRAVLPDATRVHAMLGVSPHLEAPPLDGSAFSLGLAVSEEVLDRIGRTPFGGEVESVVFRNWFDDRAVVAAEAGTAHRPARVAVVSNHFAPDVIDVLGSLEAEGAVRADYFGSQSKSVPVDGALLSRYDAVVSIGRTALLAAACGVPCIMADIHGSDGLLTIDNLDRVRTVNFSGRLTKQAITKAHLGHEIGRIFSYDRETLRSRVAADYALSARAEWLLLRYEGLLARRQRAAKAGPAFSAPGEGLAHAEIVAKVRQLRAQLKLTVETAQRDIAGVARERDDALRRLDELKRSRLLKIGRFLRRAAGRPAPY